MGDGPVMEEVSGCHIFQGSGPTRIFNCCDIVVLICEEAIVVVGTVEDFF